MNRSRRAERDVIAGLVRMTTAGNEDADLNALLGSSDVNPQCGEALIAVAREHGVEAWLAGVAGPARLDGRLGSMSATLAAQRPRFLAARARALATISRIAEVFDANDVEWAVLKGLALAASVYPHPDWRYGVDVDVLVSPTRFESAVSQLQAAGFDLLDVNWPLMAESMPGQLRLRSPNGTTVDLHWDLLNQRELRTEFRFGTADLLQRRVIIASLPTHPPLPTLHPVDQLLHVALHASLSGANRLVWLIDIDRLIRVSRPDWPTVLARAERSGTGTAAALAIARARAVYATPITESELRRLAGGGLVGRLWLNERPLIDRSRLLRTEPSRPAMAVAFARSAREGWGRSHREFLRHGLGWLRSGRPRARLPAAWLDPDSELSSLHPVPDQGAKQRYFQSVTPGHGVSA